MKLFSESRDEDIQRIADLTIKRLKEKYPLSLENINGKSASESLLSGDILLLSMCKAYISSSQQTLVNRIRTLTY